MFEALADYFCDCHGCDKALAADQSSPAARLLAGIHACAHQPRAQLMARLAGMAADAGPLVEPRAWHFLLQLLHCLRCLHGPAWPQLLREWRESEEGVGLPLASLMDLLANLYNTDAPALLDVARRGLVPLVRQGRRGPAVDLDAFLLVMMAEFAQGGCRGG